MFSTPSFLLLLLFLHDSTALHHFSRRSSLSHLSPSRQHHGHIRRATGFSRPSRPIRRRSIPDEDDFLAEPFEESSPSRRAAIDLHDQELVTEQAIQNAQDEAQELWERYVAPTEDEDPDSYPDCDDDEVDDGARKPSHPSSQNANDHHQQQQQNYHDSSSGKQSNGSSSSSRAPKKSQSDDVEDDGDDPQLDFVDPDESSSTDNIPSPNPSTAPSTVDHHKNDGDAQEKKKKEEQTRKDKEAAAQAEKDKEAAAQAEKDKEAAAQAQKDKEAAAQAEKEKTAAAQAEKDKEAAAAQAKKNQQDQIPKKNPGTALVAGTASKPHAKDDNGDDSYASPPSPPADHHSGDATFYDPGLGACGATNSPSDYIVAVSHLLYDSFPSQGGNPNTNQICGKKIRATYQGRSVDVVVQDRCEGCDKYSLDFTITAFQKLGSQEEGRLHGMTWTFI